MPLARMTSPVVGAENSVLMNDSLDFGAGVLSAQGRGWCPSSGARRRRFACAPSDAVSVVQRSPGVAILCRRQRQNRHRRRSEEHTSELQSLMRISYAVFCLKKKKYNIQNNSNIIIMKIHTNIKIKAPQYNNMHYEKLTSKQT